MLEGLGGTRASRVLNKTLNKSRIGIQFAVALIGVFFYMWNEKHCLATKTKKCCFPLAEGRNKQKTYLSQGLGACVLVCGVVRGMKCWVCCFSCCHRCDLTFMHFARFLSAFIALRCMSQCRRMPIIRGQGPTLFDGW